MTLVYLFLLQRLQILHLAWYIKFFFKNIPPKLRVYDTFIRKWKYSSWTWNWKVKWLSINCVVFPVTSGLGFKLIRSSILFDISCIRVQIGYVFLYSYVHTYCRHNWFINLYNIADSQIRILENGNDRTFMCSLLNLDTHKIVFLSCL